MKSIKYYILEAHRTAVDKLNDGLQEIKKLVPNGNSINDFYLTCGVTEIIAHVDGGDEVEWGIQDKHDAENFSNPIDFDKLKFKDKNGILYYVYDKEEWPVQAFKFIDGEISKIGPLKITDKTKFIVNLEGKKTPIEKFKS